LEKNGKLKNVLAGGRRCIDTSFTRRLLLFSVLTFDYLKLAFTEFTKIERLESIFAEKKSKKEEKEKMHWLRKKKFVRKEKLVVFT